MQIFNRQSRCQGTKSIQHVVGVGTGSSGRVGIFTGVQPNGFNVPSYDIRQEFDGSSVRRRKTWFNGRVGGWTWVSVGDPQGQVGDGTSSDGMGKFVRGRVPCRVKGGFECFHAVPHGELSSLNTFPPDDTWDTTLGLLGWIGFGDKFLNMHFSLCPRELRGYPIYLDSDRCPKFAKLSSLSREPLLLLSVSSKPSVAATYLP